MEKKSVKTIQVSVFLDFGKKAWKTFKNVTNHLADGGYFIATYLDGEKVFSKLASSKEGQIPEDNDTWKIIRKYKSSRFDIRNPFSYKINMLPILGEYIVSKDGVHVYMNQNISILSECIDSE